MALAWSAANKAAGKMMIIRQLRIFRCRALNICVTLRSLWRFCAMVVRKALSRQSGSWYCEVTSGPPLCVSIFAQEEFDTGAWFDGLQAGMNAQSPGWLHLWKSCFAGIEPNTTLVENPYSCQMRSDGKTRKITAIKLLNSIGGRHIGVRAESPCSARLER